MHPNGKHEVISIDSDSDEENKKLFKRLAKFSSSSDNDETKPMTRIKDRGNVEVIAGTSKSKIDQKVDKPVKNNNAKKTLQEILAADSVLSGSRYGTKKRKQKTETINSSSDDDEDNTNGTNTKNKKKKLKSGSPKKYMPKPGSGGYAILIALYENESSDNSEGFLTKANLQEASQKYCNESMTHTKPGNFKLLFRVIYSQWVRKF